MAKVKEVAGLTDETGVAEGIRLLSMSRFGEFQDFREEALGDDPEGLHDMRIACRRLSWALREFRSYVPARLVKRPRRRLRKIAAALGRVREEDAAIAEIEKLSGESPDEVSAGVRAMAAARLRKRARLRDALAKKIEPRRLGRIGGELYQALTRATDSSRCRDSERDGCDAKLRFRDLGRRIIEERLSEVEARSDAFFKPADLKSLHRLREAVRELRYALESFGSYWEGTAEFFDEELDRLQTALGKSNDLGAWVEALDASLLKLKGRPREGVHESAREASVWLLAHHTKSRAKFFCEALTIWNGWESRGLSARLRECLAANGTAESGSRPGPRARASVAKDCRESR